MKIRREKRSGFVHSFGFLIVLFFTACSRLLSMAEPASGTPSAPAPAQVESAKEGAVENPTTALVAKPVQSTAADLAAFEREATAPLPTTVTFQASPTSATPAAKKAAGKGKKQEKRRAAKIIRKELEVLVPHSAKEKADSVSDEVKTGASKQNNKKKERVLEHQLSQGGGPSQLPGSSVAGQGDLQGSGSGENFDELLAAAEKHRDGASAAAAQYANENLLSEVSSGQDDSFGAGEEETGGRVPKRQGRRARRRERREKKLERELGVGKEERRRKRRRRQRREQEQGAPQGKGSEQASLWRDAHGNLHWGRPRDRARFPKRRRRRRRGRHFHFRKRWVRNRHAAKVEGVMGQYVVTPRVVKSTKFDIHPAARRGKKHKGKKAKRARQQAAIESQLQAQRATSVQGDQAFDEGLDQELNVGVSLQQQVPAEQESSAEGAENIEQTQPIQSAQSVVQQESSQSEVSSNKADVVAPMVVSVAAQSQEETAVAASVPASELAPVQASPTAPAQQETPKTSVAASVDMKTLDDGEKQRLLQRLKDRGLRKKRAPRRPQAFEQASAAAGGAN